MNEFTLINHYFRQRHKRQDVVLGPGDDAAILTPPSGQQLVMTMDTLLEGCHFPVDFPAHTIGWRSLATNLSDLAAMGADPAWCLLSLSLPEADSHWLEAFCDGFFALADKVGIDLVGGDIVKGPLAVTIQATGFVPTGKALTRQGAQVGDAILIGGIPGEAAAGLAAWQAGERAGKLVERFCYPKPQLVLGKQLRDNASSCIDISDGLLADLTHLLEESGVAGAEINTDAIPISAELGQFANQAKQLDYQLRGGDDYLLLFTQARQLPVPNGCHIIGHISEEKGLKIIGSRQPITHKSTGWQHF